MSPGRRFVELQVPVQWYNHELRMLLASSLEGIQDMTRLESVIDIQASRERVWEILVDVERWPEWTPTVLSVQREDSGVLSVGSRAYIRQPKIRPARWEVTQLAAPRNFTWISRSPGVLVTAGHVIEAVGGGSRITLSLEFSGFLSFLIFPLMRGLSQRYIATEAQKLKERSERS
jgi:uncharacterized membrane protein